MQTPSSQIPRPLHSLGHGGAMLQSSPENGRAHEQTPALQIPRPLQSLGQGIDSLQVGPV